MYIVRCPQPTMLTNTEADVLQVRLPPGVFATRSAGSRSSSEMTMWFSWRTRWALGTQAALHIWHFTVSLCSAAYLHLLFLKGFGELFQSCFRSGQTSAAKECDSSILQLHQESWIIRMRTHVSLLQLQVSEVFCPISSLYRLGHKS